MTDKLNKYIDFINNEKPINNVITHLFNESGFICSVNNERVEKNSYVVSPISLYKDYAVYETNVFKNKIIKYILVKIIKCVAKLLEISKMDNVLMVNNWLLSTNIYNSEVGLENVEKITKVLIKDYKDKPILWRSLNNFSNKETITNLIKAKYVLIPSRQVYIFDSRSGKNSQHNKKQTTRTDINYIEKTEYKVEINPTIKDEDFKRIKELYDNLYIKKYCDNNPQFSEKWFKFMYENNLLELIVIKDKDLIIGVGGIYKNKDIMTLPVVGYDFNYPKESRLYRLIIAKALDYSNENKLIFNISSGASDFKSIRGAIPNIEYSLVYVNHLNVIKKVCWKVLSVVLNKVAVPIMKRYKL